MASSSVRSKSQCRTMSPMSFELFSFATDQAPRQRIEHDKLWRQWLDRVEQPLCLREFHQVDRRRNGPDAKWALKRQPVMRLPGAHPQNQSAGTFGGHVDHSAAALYRGSKPRLTGCDAIREVLRHECFSNPRRSVERH